MGESKMNSHLFERKNFLEGSWIKQNTEDYFSVDRYNDYLVLKVNLLRATAHESEVLNKLLKKFDNRESEQIIFDLSKSTFIDSTFLSTLITFKNRNEGKVKLIISDRKQLAIFKLTKIDSLFQIFTSLEKAMVS